jgi:hypothetical protein
MSGVCKSTQETWGETRLAWEYSIKMNAQVFGTPGARPMTAREQNFEIYPEG